MQNVEESIDNLQIVVYTIVNLQNVGGGIFGPYNETMEASKGTFTRRNGFKMQSSQKYICIMGR